MAMSRSARGYTAALVSAIFLSTTSIFIRYLVTNFDMPPLILAFWRNVFVIATLVPAMLLINPRLLRVELRHIPFLAMFGSMMGAFNGLWAISVANNGAAVATVMVYCSVAYTAVLGWKFLGERLGWVKFAAIALCIGGCALISGALNAVTWQVNFLGLVAGLLTGMCYTAYSLMGRMTSERGISPWTTLLYIFTFAVLFLFLVNLSGGRIPGSATNLADLFWLGDSVRGWAVMVLLGAIPTVGGYGFYNVSLCLLDASIANIIVSLEPAFTAVFAYLILAEVLTPVQMLGGALLLSGVAAIKLADLRKTALPVPQEA